MTAELFRQVSALNPIPGDAVVPDALHPAAIVLQEIDERTATMQTKERTLSTPPVAPRPTRRAWVAVAAFVVVLVLGVVFVIGLGGDRPPVDSTTTTTTEATTTTTEATTTTTTEALVTIPAEPAARLDAFLAAVADGDAETAAILLGPAADAEFLVATGWVDSAAPCGLEVPDDPQFYACDVTTASAVAERIGDTTVTLTFEYDEASDAFVSWQPLATRFTFEYLYYARVYDAEAFAAACPDPDFLAGAGRTAECGAYLASIDAAAAVVQPAVESLEAGVTRINDVTPADGAVLQNGENRFDRTTRLFSLFAAGSTVSVDVSNVGTTVLTAEDGTTIEIVSPLLYAAPGPPLGATSVSVPVPLLSFGGFEQWLTAAGIGTIADQGELELGGVIAEFYDIDWTQSGAIMRLTARPAGDKVVEAGTSERIYVIDHPDGLPLIVFVTAGPGGQDEANATVASVLDGITLRTTPVYP